MSPSFNSIMEEDDILNFECEITLSPFGEKVTEYIAGFVVYSLKTKIKCDFCLKALFGSSDDKSLVYHKTKGRLIYASKNVISLCRQCEKVIRCELDENKKLNKACNTKLVVNRALQFFIGEDLFPNIENHDSDNFVNHEVELAKAVMEKYCNTRICYLTKKTDPAKCIRHIYSKLIHFKNQ